ncbi:MAG: ATP-binding cassette domain-containing protein [Lachnospiraceae bacterium]|nr:ATP-binding cassette domain-containing protein [Lachnospiraceae bacterium]
MELGIDILKKLGSFHLNLQMQTEERRIGILGASGCGKSMTLKCIAGIETPDRGKIQAGLDCLFDSAEKINVAPQRRKIGYLFQNYALFPTMTVAQNVAAGLKGSRAEMEKRTAGMIEKFQLAGLEKRLPGELSGGQQQRVALARIMAYEPGMILLDEPFSALDIYLKEQLMQEMRQLLKDYDGTVILVSHSRDEIYQFSDALLTMDQGKAVRFGNTREVFANPGNRMTARLTGCKNISAARKTGPWEVYASDWNLTLRTGLPVSDTLRYIGIRAHDIEAAGQAGANTLPCHISSVTEAPFETIYMAACQEREQVLWWKQAKNRMGPSAMAQIPEYLYLPPERLLQLEE